MVQIYNEPSFGKVLGTGIAQSLNALAQNKMQQIQQRNQQKQNAQGLSSLQGFSPEMAESLSALDPQILAKVLPGIQQSQREQQFAQQFQTQPEQMGVQGKNNPLMPEGFPAPRNSKEALELGKIALKQRQVLDKETLPAYQEITREAKVAKNNDKRLDKLEKLAIKGNLGSPLANSLIDTLSHGIFGVGINLNRLKTADAQEFEKISSEFVKDAKEIFGSRITDNDLKAFMKTVPTLSNSREGMLQIINNLKVSNAAAKVKKDVADQIISENGGSRPANFEQLVEERANPELDKLAGQFEVSKTRTEVLGSPALGSLAQTAGLLY